MKKSIFLWSILTLIIVTSPALALEAQPERNSKLLDKNLYPQTNSGTKEMVVTAHPLSTEAAYKTLENGGNAIDAAITAQLVLGLVEPQSSGLGGGAFVLYYDANTQKVYSLDGRETAPSTATPDMFLKSDGSPQDFFTASTSRNAIGVPAIPELLFQMHKYFGTKSQWPSLFDDAIDLSLNGFEMTPRLIDSVERYKKRLQKSGADKYFEGNEKNLKNKDYARTLTKLRDIGPRAISPRYNIKFRAPVCGDYRAYTVCSMGEPSSGGLTLLSILSVLNGYDLGQSENAAAYHLYIEASKLTFADRNYYMADPAFVDTPGTALIDPKYIQDRSKLISTEAAINDAPHGTPTKTKLKSPHNGPDESGTTHISIVDRFGNAVSMTSSVEYAFGTGIMKDGYFLNNQLTDFSFMPEKDGRPIANRVEAGKRPRSSMTPVIVFDKNSGKPVIIIGSAGGSRIIGYVTQRLIALLDWNIPAADVLALPNILARGNTVEVDLDFPSKTINQLKALGHPIKQLDMNSGLALIDNREDGIIGVADPRREGTALGR